MIKMIVAPGAGNALLIDLVPPCDARYWRVLRRTVDAFTGPDDAGAVCVVDGSTTTRVLDTNGLINGTAYFYRTYYWQDEAWTADAGSVTGTPMATFFGDSPDPQTIVRDRLDLGLAAEVARGFLKPQSGRIPVVTAPFGLVAGVAVPCVSVHLNSDAPAHFGIGDFLQPDTPNSLGGWDESIGVLSSIQIGIVGVSLNLDERIALRRAIKRVIIANLEVFALKGLITPQISLHDDEDLFGENTPLYRTNGAFTCLIMSGATETIGAITDVDVETTPHFEGDPE